MPLNLRSASPRPATVRSDQTIPATLLFPPRITNYIFSSRIWPARIKGLLLRQVFDPGSCSAMLLQAPRLADGRLIRGVLVGNQIDAIIEQFPPLASLFYMIERRGWYGINSARKAHIKLVEDSSTLRVTQKRFPHAILLELSGGDFVDTRYFRPLDHEPDFDVIQIACWSPRKRVEMMIDAAARIPHVRFVHFGHFERDGAPDELAYRDACIARAEQSGANIHFPFREARSNADTVTGKEEINAWINRAKLGLLTTKLEGHPRFKMECMAADRPVFVPRDTTVPTRKHIVDQTGGLFEPNPQSVADTITRALAQRDTYHPRDYVLQHTGRVNSLAKIRGALRRLEPTAEGDGPPYEDIDWDGRNENLWWGQSAVRHLRELAEQYEPLISRN